MSDTFHEWLNTLGIFASLVWTGVRCLIDKKRLSQK
jgi:hypothetical protein